MINQTEFSDKNRANIVGLGAVLFFFIGILFPMWVAIEQLAANSKGIEIGLYLLFAAIGLVGVGGVLFLIQEIEHISGAVLTGVPVGLAGLGIAVFLLPRIVQQFPGTSVRLFLVYAVGFLISFIGRYVFGIIIRNFDR